VPVEGVVFLQFLLGALAIVTVAVGMGVIAVGLHRGRDFSQFRSTIHNLVSPVLKAEWGEYPARTTTLLVDGFEKYANFWFRQSEHNFLVSGLFMIIVLVGIPAGALWNAMRGGSPFLIYLFVGLALTFVLLAVLGELNKYKGLAALLSAFLFTALFIFVPGYVFYSFTDRLLNLPVGHAAIGSFLIVPLLYLASQSVVLAIRQLFRRRSAMGHLVWIERQVIYVSAALPIAYLSLFAAFLAGQFSVEELPIPKTWPMVMAGLVLISLSLSASVQAYRTCKENTSISRWVLVTLLGLLVSAGLALMILRLGLGSSAPDLWESLNILVGLAPSGEYMSLGPLFWLMHLVFIPMAGLVLLLGLLLAARILTQFSAGWGSNSMAAGAGTCVQTGISFLVFGIATGAVAAVI